MTEVEIKTGMTDAECERLDNYYTQNTFTPGPNLLKQDIKPGEVRNTLVLKDVDREVIEYLRFRATIIYLKFIFLRRNLAAV
jgi:hypothetical protein